MRKQFLFVGCRFGVLEFMIRNNLDVIAIIPSDIRASIPPSLFSSAKKYFFKTKDELISLITNSSFDILVSNGCPYILPVSKLKKHHQIFVNLHPSLLPNLRGPHPINGSILFDQKTGATCHIMDDGIDTGAIISQIEVNNDSNIDLALLYQMCFLAEIQAFELALKSDFAPQADNTNNMGDKFYFKRTEESMMLDLAVDNLQTIIKKVRAFNLKNQYAKLYFKNTKHSIFSAKIIYNSFLTQSFQDIPRYTIVMLYENFILAKWGEEFLELGIVEGILNFQIGESLKQQKQLSIYQTIQYSKCSSQNQFEFIFTRDNQTFSNLSEVSKIPHTQYSDMVSPYGYSGYFTDSLDHDFIQEALEMQNLQAQKQNIIAEFIRFNPYQNHQIFAKFLDFYTLEKQIVEVDTNYQNRWNDYQSRLKGKIRKSLSMLQIKQSDNLKKFFELYTETMQRNEAQNFYFFSLEYFKKLSKLNEFIMFEALYQNKVCAMAIFLIDGHRSYYHLGANSIITLTKNLNAMGAIFETFFQYAEQRGVASCLLGGGRTTSPDDNLLKYKKQYSSKLIPFYIGGKIYNHREYQRLSRNCSNHFFLKYRYTTRGGGYKLRNLSSYSSTRLSA